MQETTSKYHCIDSRTFRRNNDDCQYTSQRGDAMVKGESIYIRIDEDVKRRIEAAAKKKGQTMTTFITEAAERAARQVEKQPVAGKFRGVPSWFRCRCAEASRGGNLGYADAGHMLATQLPEPFDIESDEWWEEKRKLGELLLPTHPDDREKEERGELIRVAYELRDDEAVFAWFEGHYPKCMKLVPHRRWRQFLEGVYRAQEADDVDFDV
jgi:hypothetical protein